MTRTSHHESIEEEKPCEICSEPLSEEEASYAGEVLRVHEECKPSNNIDVSDHPAFGDVP